MAVRVSKEVTDQVRECRFVLSAFQTEGSHIAGTLTGLTLPNLEENDETPGFGSTIVGLSRNLESALGQLVVADTSLTAAVGWESTLRKEHNEKSEAQGLILGAMRRTTLAQYVEPDMENLGLQPVDVVDGVTVSRRSSLVSERFAAPNLAKMLGPPRFENPADLTPFLTQVRNGAQELTALGLQVNEAERRTARARLEKKRLQEAHAKLLLRTARVFEDLCRLAGDDELADKIRRTVRSRTSTPETGEEPGEVEPEPIGEAGALPEGEVSLQEA